jgi:SHS2 domain-containing protein
LPYNTLVPFSFFDHTGDIGVDLRAVSLEQLFADAALAITEILTDPALVVSRVSVEVSLSSPEIELLMVDWLNELLYLFETQALLVRSARVTLGRKGEEHRLNATIEGEPFDPGRHPIKVTLKAVTYHALEVVETAGGWRARVVIDV